MTFAFYLSRAASELPGLWGCYTIDSSVRHEQGDKEDGLCVCLFVVLSRICSMLFAALLLVGGVPWRLSGRSSSDPAAHRLPYLREMRHWNRMRCPPSPGLRHLHRPSL